MPALPDDPRIRRDNLPIHNTSTNHTQPTKNAIRAPRPSPPEPPAPSAPAKSAMRSNSLPRIARIHPTNAEYDPQRAGTAWRRTILRTHHKTRSPDGTRRKNVSSPGQQPCFPQTTMTAPDSPRFREKPGPQTGNARRSIPSANNSSRKTDNPVRSRNARRRAILPPTISPQKRNPSQKITQPSGNKRNRIRRQRSDRRRRRRRRTRTIPLPHLHKSPNNPKRRPRKQNPQHEPRRQPQQRRLQSETARIHFRSPLKMSMRRRS